MDPLWNYAPGPSYSEESSVGLCLLAMDRDIPIHLDGETVLTLDKSSVKAEQMEREIKALKDAFISRLREISAMASLRETIASSLLQGSSNSPNEYSGPGHSPGETRSSQNPPHGAEVRRFATLLFFPIQWY